MLLRIYLPVIFFGITIVFGSDFGEESNGNSASENNAEVAVVSSDNSNPSSTKGVSSSGTEIEVHSHVKEKQKQRQERMEAEMRKGKGSKKSGKGVAEDLCRKFLYVLPLLTVLPILFLLWKKHEPQHHTYSHYGHGHHGHGHGHGHKDHHQSYYKKLDDASFDYYRQQPLLEQGLVA